MGRVPIQCDPTPPLKHRMTSFFHQTFKIKQKAAWPSEEQNDITLESHSQTHGKGILSNKTKGKKMCERFHPSFKKAATWISVFYKWYRDIFKEIFSLVRYWISSFSFAPSILVRLVCILKEPLRSVLPSTGFQATFPLNYFSQNSSVWLNKEVQIPVC